MHILHEQMYLLYKQALSRNGYFKLLKQYLDTLCLICTILILKYLKIFNLLPNNVPLF